MFPKADAEKKEPPGAARGKQTATGGCRMRQTEKIRGRAAGKPPVPERLFFQVFLLVEESRFQHAVFFVRANRLAFFLVRLGTPEQIRYFPARKTGALTAFFNVVFLDTVDQTIGALLVGGASGAPNLLDGNNPVSPADSKP